MHRINRQAAKTQQASVAREDYALHRMMVALDRVIAGKTEEQKRRDMTWASLWRNHWKSGLNKGK